MTSIATAFFVAFHVWANICPNGVAGGYLYGGDGGCGPQFKRIKVIGNNGGSCLHSKIPAASASIMSAATVAVPRPHRSCYSQSGHGLVNGCCGYGGPGLMMKGSAVAVKRNEMLDKLILKKAQKLNCNSDGYKYHPLQKHQRLFVKPTCYNSAGCGVYY